MFEKNAFPKNCYLQSTNITLTHEYQALNYLPRLWVIQRQFLSRL